MGDNNESVLGKLIFWTVVIIAGAVVLRLVFAAVGIAVFLAFRLLPILIVAWVLYRAWKWIADKPAASEVLERVLGAEAAFKGLGPEDAVLVGKGGSINCETFRFLKTPPKHVFLLRPFGSVLAP